jgi:hypothetical protein
VNQIAVRELVSLCFQKEVSESILLIFLSNLPLVMTTKGKSINSESMGRLLYKSNIYSF